MKNTVFPVLLCLAGCAPASTVGYHPNVDYGTPIDFDSAQQQARAVMEGLLKDPFSAQWQCFPMKEGSLGDGKAFGSAMAGFLLPCKVNAKNSFGAYGGAVPYIFLFRDQQLRRAVEIGQSAIGETQRVVYDH